MNLSNAHEKLGLRDYNDPEARRRANEESDLELKMTLTQGLFVASTFDFFALFLSMTPEQLLEYQEMMSKSFPNEEAKEAFINHMKKLGQDTMTEVYRKQREIYADSIH